jgi:hypothetical protein
MKHLNPERGSKHHLEHISKHHFNKCPNTCLVLLVDGV